MRLFGRKKKEAGNGTDDVQIADPSTGMARLLYDMNEQAENEFVKFVVEHLERIHQPGGYEREKKEADFMDLGMGRPYLAALDDVQLSIDDTVVRAETRGRNPQCDVVTQWTVRGVHARRLAGIEPTGEPIAIEGVTISTVRDYRLRSDYSYWQSPELTRQLLGA